MLSHVLKCRLISFNYSSFSMLIEASNSLQERRERETSTLGCAVSVREGGSRIFGRRFEWPLAASNPHSTLIRSIPLE